MALNPVYFMRKLWFPSETCAESTLKESFLHVNNLPRDQHSEDWFCLKTCRDLMNVLASSELR